MSITSANLLLEKPKYKFTKTAAGMWKEFLYENGAVFREYRSHRTIGGKPLVCIANGRNPETGKMAVAEGIIAIGQRARGWLAIGQFVNGNIAIGQFATGRIAAVGQFAVAPLAIGQFSVAIAAIAQFGIGGTGIFQMGQTFFGGIGVQIVDLGRLLS